MVKIEIASLSDIKELEVLDPHISRNALCDSVKHGWVYIAKKEDITIGLLRYSLFWQSIPFLDLIFLDKKFRGQKIGSAMMKKWEEDMSEMGYTDVMTSTQADETAYVFYEKLRYRKNGSFFPPNQDAEEWIYTKKIKK